MVRFTEPSLGQMSKHSTDTFSECVHYGIPYGSVRTRVNVPVLCFDIWPDDGSVNWNMSPSF